MSSGIERENNSGEYDPLAKIDHSAVCQRFLAKIQGNSYDYIQMEYDRQAKTGRPVFVSYEKIAMYLCEVEGDEYLEPGDSVAAFKYGTVVALAMIEQLADEIAIDAEEFYEQWQTSNVVSLVDISSERYSDLSKGEKLNRLREGIIRLGQKAFYNLPDSYLDAVATIKDEHDLLGMHEIAFSAGFGYVMGFGYAALQYAYEKKNIISDLDVELQQLVEANNAQAVPTHESIAETLSLLLEDDEVSIEEVLGEVISSNLADYEDAVETLNAFSLAVYPNEFGNSSLDDVGEACFNGANLGFYVGIELYQLESSDIQECVNRWQRVRLHQALQKDEPESVEHIKSDSHRILSRVLQTSETPRAYSDVFAIIDTRLNFDEDEGVAFRNGFQYALQTLERQVLGQRKAEASLEVADVMSRYEVSEYEFMRDYDITGSLQEVYTAYLSHCKVLGLDPDAMTEVEAETVLELTICDYERLMPELTEIAINGPCFMQIHDGHTDERDAVLLETGGFVRGEICGFRIISSPSDLSYAAIDMLEIGQFPLRYMPGFVMKNVSMTLNTGETGKREEHETIMVGFAVPGARYRRV